MVQTHQLNDRGCQIGIQKAGINFMLSIYEKKCFGNIASLLGCELPPSEAEGIARVIANLSFRLKTLGSILVKLCTYRQRGWI